MEKTDYSLLHKAIKEGADIEDGGSDQEDI